MDYAVSVSARLDQVLDVPELKDLVHIYFSPDEDSPFAGSTFDTLGENVQDRFGVADLIALNLLDERIGPPAIRTILNGAADGHLAAVPANCDLWEATD